MNKIYHSFIRLHMEFNGATPTDATRIGIEGEISG